MRRSKVLVIGSGAAGYTAAIYAARAALEPILICGMQVGGQLTITTDVENYPGFAEPVQGPWLMEQMRKQAASAGAALINDEASEVKLSERPFAVTVGGERFLAETLVIATGAKARWLGLASESHFRGHGVSSCATCDGFFFKNKKVAVVGGGNTAAEEALYLTAHADEVTLIHRRDRLRAEAVLQRRLFANPKIKPIWDAKVIEVLGDHALKRVTGVKIRNLKTNEEKRLELDGLFVAIGHDPATELFKGQLSMLEGGYIAVRDSVYTDIPGVFAAGDVADPIYRQAVTAAGMGCMSAIAAGKFLDEFAQGGGD